MSVPKSICVTRVKNEIDIIEAFVRHHAVHFDRIIALDDGSSDGTYELLLALQRASLPLVVLREPSVGYQQDRYMTRLMKIAFERFGAEWVAPLDADEFIEPPLGMSLSDVLAGQEPALLSLGWSNFVWVDDEPSHGISNPVERLTQRMPPRDDLRKVIVPFAAFGPNAELWVGNHGLTRDGRHVPARPLGGTCLCHFPIRSLEQYASKVAVGSLQVAADPERKGDQASHYRKPYEALLGGGVDALAGMLREDSRTYSAAADIVIEAAPRHEPFRYAGGSLARPVPPIDVLANTLNCAHAIARELAGRALRSPGHGNADLAELCFGDGQAARQVALLYRIVLGRTPDRGGMLLHLARLESGASLRDVAGNFLASEEFRAGLGRRSALEALHDNAGEGFSASLKTLPAIDVLLALLARDDVRARFVPGLPGLALH